MRRSFALLLAAVPGLAGGFPGLPPVASAATRAVPGAYPTVTAAIAAAQPGDTVLVAPGTYTTSGWGETYPLDVTTANVTLLGAGMGVSILDMEGQAGSVVRLRAPNARLEGFTVTGGVAVRGGGVFLGVGATGTPVVAHCLVIENGASDRGSAIFADVATTPWIHHNVTWMNFDPDVPAGGDPHGIELLDASGVIEHNLIGRGDSNGLLNIGASSLPIVRNNIFYRNGIPGVRGRGFCALGTQTATIRNNLYYANEIAAVIMRVNGVPTDMSGAASNAVSLSDEVDGNLDMDPLLANEGALDFALTSTSPAIDAGWPGSPLDPDGTQADIGPFFFDQRTLEVCEPCPAPGPGGISMYVRPNPAPRGAGTRFRLRLARDVANADVAVYDARGRLVVALATGPQLAGEFDVRWDGRDAGGTAVRAGVYFVRARIDGGSTGSRIVVVD